MQVQATNKKWYECIIQKCGFCRYENRYGGNFEI